MTGTVAKLQKLLENRTDVRFVTFTVDPERDREKDLSAYADRFGADPERWLFLTGTQNEIHRIVRGSFFLPVEQKKDDIEHSPRLAVVDRDGNIRGYFEGRQVDDEGNPIDDTPRVVAAVDALLREGQPPTLREVLPTVNACLNATSALLIVLGGWAVRTRRIRLHKGLMLSAFVVSSAFLASYLYYHFVVIAGQHTTFRERVPEAPLAVVRTYQVILGSHTVLAALAAPLVLASLFFGLRNRIATHRRLARWTLPIWLYVSVTGVVVYWMLYRLYPSP